MPGRLLLASRWAPPLRRALSAGARPGAPPPPPPLRHPPPPRAPPPRAAAAARRAPPPPPPRGVDTPPPPPPPPPNPPLWAWGVADDGRLGVDPATLTDETETVGSAAHAPARVWGLHGVAVTAAAAGAGHSLALDAAGRVWSWGLGGDGQLGHGEWASCWVPRPLPAAALGGGGAVAIAAGARHSLVATADGGVYAFGSNGAGQLGLTSAAAAGAGAGAGAAAAAAAAGGAAPYFGARAPRAVATPTPIPALADVAVTSVAAGDAFSVALAADGAVYTFGASGGGQLGHGLPAGAGSLWAPLGALLSPAGAAAAAAPRRVRALAGERVASIAAGPSHVVALTPGGGALSWGAGRGWAHAAPERGEGDVGELTPVAGLAGVPVAKVAPGGAHTLALTAGGGCSRGALTRRGGSAAAAPPTTRRPCRRQGAPRGRPVGGRCGPSRCRRGRSTWRRGGALASPCVRMGRRTRGGGGGGVLGVGDPTDRWAPALVGGGRDGTGGGVGGLRRATAGFAHVLAT
ncbi:hypothetical protein BU14_0438s0009 [Porphyra umbilicalis]|uniref:Uncharacterized protein n=1 Tax=Porphyra umbilicalis TaxID=2786 RepID=A0A1X6NUU7_PORUM|nr:hypothetical protein BU14_0438s0009 [Porphyra umbilicalis]|eukprot:OSX72414.1 hypothetical protein BU14_0438s0009 [Porphyra umbilicalis]